MMYLRLILLGLLVLGAAAEYANLLRYMKDTRYYSVSSVSRTKVKFQIRIFDNGDELYYDDNLDATVTFGDIGPSFGVIEMENCRLEVDLASQNKKKACNGDYGAPYSLAPGDYQLGSLNGNYYAIWCPNIFFEQQNFGLRPCFKYSCDGTYCWLKFPNYADFTQYYYASFNDEQRKNVVLKFNVTDQLYVMKTLDEVFPLTPGLDK